MFFCRLVHFSYHVGISGSPKVFKYLEGFQVPWLLLNVCLVPMKKVNLMSQ